VWNTGLEQRRAYRRRGAWISYHEQAHELADAKDEHSWLAEAPGHCLQQTLMDLDKACRAHGTFGVRWRSGRRWRPSLRFPEGKKISVEKLNRRHARVQATQVGLGAAPAVAAIGRRADSLRHSDPRGPALVYVSLS
jgi:putative transposase